MKQITLLHGPYEGDDKLDECTGYLVDPSYAMNYDDKHRQLWFSRVEPTGKPNTYLITDGIVLTRRSVDIGVLFDHLHKINAYTFITSYLFREVAGIEMFPSDESR